MNFLKLPRALSIIIINHVNDHSPEEACGLLAGVDHQVSLVIPVTNQLHSPVKYYMVPVELLRALETIESKELSLLGIFHSHPNGPSTPSPTDIREFLYPGVVTIICYPEENDWRIKGFMIENNGFSEVEMRIG